MTEREPPESDEEPEKRRPLPPRPDRDSEKALGLEVAKLFGLSPRDLMARPSPPADRSKAQDVGEADRSDEDPEPVQGDS